MAAGPVASCMSLSRNRGRPGHLYQRQCFTLVTLPKLQRIFGEVAVFQYIGVMPTSNIPKVEIEEEFIAEFEKAIAIALSFQSPVPVGSNQSVNIKTIAVPDYFWAGDRSLVVSFDANWSPFLCNSKGHNRGPQKWYIPQISRLFDIIADALQISRRQEFSFVPGGRVFLNAEGVRRRLKDSEILEVLRWELSRDCPFLNKSIQLPG